MKRTFHYATHAYMPACTVPMSWCVPVVLLTCLRAHAHTACLLACAGPTEDDKIVLERMLAKSLVACDYKDGDGNWINEIADLAWPELAKFLKASQFTEEESDDVKKYRRRKKNRGYAQKSRSKKRNQTPQPMVNSLMGNTGYLGSIPGMQNIFKPDRMRGFPNALSTNPQASTSHTS